MLSLLVTLVIIPVQDRAISVTEFIKGFDTESVKHVASKEIGDNIIFVHAQDKSADEIKKKLATALSATWRKTDTGFRLERPQTQAKELERKEAAERAKIFAEYKETLRKKLAEHQTAESRANAALQSLLKFQEKYRISRPDAFKPETDMPADWLLFSILDKIDPVEIASQPFAYGRQLSNKPFGEQRQLPSGTTQFILDYERDRLEMADFADTILNATAEGPMSDWIKEQVEDVRQPRSLERVLFQFGRGSESFNAGIFLFDSSGEIFTSSSIWTPTFRVPDRFEVPYQLTAEFTDVQRAFVESAYGYKFIRDPHPEAIDKIMGVEPLCSTEPLLRELAKHKAKPLIAVLDDRLLSAIDRATGSIKNVSSFVQKAEDTGAITTLENAEWIILRPPYLLDTEWRRFDRSAIKPFLDSTKKAGYVTIEGHIAVNGASPYSYIPLPEYIGIYLDNNGYVLVSETNRDISATSRVVKDVLKLRGGLPREPTEVPVSALSLAGRAELLRGAIGGAASLEARPGQTATSLERNGNYALPYGLRADSVVRIIPITAGCVGLKQPFPNAYSAEELGWACGSYRKSPTEMMADPYWYGERRGVQVEMLLTPKAMLSSEYFESAGEMKEMKGYSSLPAEFRKEVEKAHEEAHKFFGGGS